jgi:hypothetical protein
MCKCMCVEERIECLQEGKKKGGGGKIQARESFSI